MFSLRFDMRLVGSDPKEQYAAALAMAEWGEEKGASMALVSEHHGSPDGYLPAPLILASAMAARTEQLAIHVAALLLPLHDPIRLAEEMAVLDILSCGRVSYVLALGYRPEEYAMFGQLKSQRGKRMDQCLEALLAAWRGEPFEYEGRPVQVFPKPITPGGPRLFLGGSSPAAIRRAARFGLGMITQGGDSVLAELYQAECQRMGTKPGVFVNPPMNTVTTAFVAEDPDKAWQEIGPYLLHDATEYARWLVDHEAATKSQADSIDALRAERGAYRIFTPDEAVTMIREGSLLMLHPLCGGLPAKIAWRYLNTFEHQVLARLRPD